MKIHEIAAARLRELNSGRAESATLTEGLAVDFGQLWEAVCPEITGAWPGPAGIAAAGIVARMTAMGAMLAKELGEEGWRRAAAHGSDTVRGWAAFALGAAPGLDFAERVARVRPLADDGHFGVREWAWLALRPHLAADLERGLSVLAPLAGEASANLRRFASELSRPRGVWCTHLKQLKADPAPGLVILEPLRADPARYVQDSVANWLNDAAKSQPEWVRQVCARWQSESSTEATRRISRRALRFSSMAAAADPRAARSPAQARTASKRRRRDG